METVEQTVATTLAGGTGGDAGPTGRPAVGDRLGRYELGEMIGTGGMGAVYSARDPELDREVAVKLLRSDRANDPAATARLVREAQSLARLQHPRVVSVFEVGVADGQAFIAMEYVRGQPLHRWQAQPGRTREEILHVYTQAAEGLAAAHSVEITHRDFKPANVLVGDDGRARVLDFGIAVLGGTTAPIRGTDDSAPLTSSSSANTLTRVGDVLGTPSYMAPEQHTGGVVDHRSDQYSFCVALWEALYGTRPFRGRSHDALARRKLERAIDPVEEPRHPVPGWLRRVLVRGLDPDPNRRWPSMQALGDELTPASRSWIGPAAAVAVPLALTGWLALVAGPPEGNCDVPTDALDGIWDPSTQNRLAARFGGSSSADVSAVWERVEPQLNRYVASWQDAYRSACEAGHDAAALDLRMGCLHRRKTALASLTDALVRGEPAVLRDAGLTAASLPRVEECAEVEALRGRLPRPPDDVADVVEDLRRKVGVATTLGKAGRYDEALALANEIARAQSETGYEPLRLENDDARGTIMGDTTRIDEAIPLLEQTVHSASAIRYHAVEARAATTLVYLAGALKGDDEAGRRWGRHAFAVIEAGKLGDLERATLETNLGSIELGRGRLEEAMTLYESALEKRNRILGSEHPETGVVLANQASVLVQQGKFEEAERTYRRVIEIWEVSLGSGHPKLSICLNGLSGVLDRLGRIDEAAPLAERAVEIRRSTLGERHPKLATALETVGSLHLKRGDYDLAQQRFEEALEIRESVLPAGDLQMGSSWINLGMLAEKQGRHAYSIRAARKAVTIVETQLGPTHPFLAYPLTSWGISALALGDVDDAHAHVQRALILRTENPTPEGERARTEFALARVLAARGQAQQARELAVNARDRLPTDPVAKRQRAEIDRWLAKQLPPAD